MSLKCHYEVLGVSKQATKEEIKAAFRKLSFENHPDVAKDADGEAFKAIANAHSVLSCPNERRKYDRQQLEKSMWRPGRAPGQGGDWYGGDNFRRPHGRAPKPGMHVAMETLQNPRYILFGIAGFGAMLTMASFLGGVSSRQPQYHSPMVEAWKNPKTGKWEQPAPWDPVYRKLKPTLELVPREKVQRRSV